MKLTAPFLIIVFMVFKTNGQAQDWPNLQKFQKANAELKPPMPNENRVVFMGNSITEGWSQMYPEFFKNKSYINRGISGQTTPQMLLRFKQDVIDLQPKVVVILAGTNDLAGNTGPATNKMITDNIFSMAELAQNQGIRIVLSSILPVYDYPWREGIFPSKRISAINLALKNYAQKHGHVYLDYHSEMKDSREGMQEKYTTDGVHASKKGYILMSALAEKAIQTTLK